jgi:hypothetical protein
VKYQGGVAGTPDRGHKTHPYRADARQRLRVVPGAREERDVRFVSAERERLCPPLPEIEGARAISITYPRSLAPDEKLRFEVVAAPRSPYQLREDRGDFLSNLGGDDADLSGSPSTGRRGAGHDLGDPQDPANLLDGVLSLIVEPVCQLYLLAVKSPRSAPCDLGHELPQALLASVHGSGSVRTPPMRQRRGI